MTDKLIPLKIAGVGYCIPDTVVTNDDLTKLYDTSDEWIYSRTGIKERRITDYIIVQKKKKIGGNNLV